MIGKIFRDRQTTQFGLIGFKQKFVNIFWDDRNKKLIYTTENTKIKINNFRFIQVNKFVVRQQLGHDENRLSSVDEIVMGGNDDTDFIHNVVTVIS